ncbi:RNase H domain-containing protein [Trichonephila clavipes]|nr:RNase H domain-containing protein [Trichonephila clavipes]
MPPDRQRPDRSPRHSSWQRAKPRATTGGLPAPLHDEFRGPRSDYVRQVALATPTLLLTFAEKSASGDACKCLRLLPKNLHIVLQDNAYCHVARDVPLIHFQWIPSHFNIAGNEIADSLARAGAGETTMSAAPLTYLELFSKHKAKNKAIWMIPMVHPWYQSKCLGGSLVRGSSRRDQTVLTRFLRGHLMSLTFVNGIKHFEICTKYSAQASPGHILSCLGLTRQD